MGWLGYGEIVIGNGQGLFRNWPEMLRAPNIADNERKEAGHLCIGVARKYRHREQCAGIDRTCGQLLERVLGYFRRVRVYWEPLDIARHG